MANYEWCVTFKKTMKTGHSDYTCHLKNLFGCEAHNEMMTRFTDVCYRGEFPKYKAMQDEIKKYQTIRL